MHNSKRQFKVKSFYMDDESFSIDRLFETKEVGANDEFIYALHEIIDDVLDMKVDDFITFKCNRDDPKSISLLRRTH